MSEDNKPVKGATCGSINTSSREPTNDSIKTLLNERSSTHGDFLTTSSISQLLKAVMTGNWEVLIAFTGFLASGNDLTVNSLTPTMRESLDMIATKIGRILSGNPSHIDSWQDIAGYAQLVVNKLTAIEEKKVQYKADSALFTDDFITMLLNAKPNSIIAVSEGQLAAIVNGDWFISESDSSLNSSRQETHKPEMYISKYWNLTEADLIQVNRLKAHLCEFTSLAEQNAFAIWCKGVIPKDNLNSKLARFREG